VVSQTSSPLSRREAELRKTLEKWKAFRTKQFQRRQWEQAEAAARAAAEAERRQQVATSQAALAIEAEKAAAMSRMSQAAQVRAEADLARYRLQSQAWGRPQLFVPGVGFVPYPYAIARPLFGTVRPVLPGRVEIQPVPQGRIEIQIPDAAPAPSAD
jgi:hypothetical protein